MSHKFIFVTLQLCDPVGYYFKVNSWMCPLVSTLICSEHETTPGLVKPGAVLCSPSDRIFSICQPKSLIVKLPVILARLQICGANGLAADASPWIRVSR